MSGQIEIEALEKAVRVGAQRIKKYAKDLKDLGATIADYRGKYGDLELADDGSAIMETDVSQTMEKKKDLGEISYYDRLVNAVSKSADKVRKLKAALEKENKKLSRYQMLEEQERKDQEAAADMSDSDASGDLDRMLSVDEDDSDEEEDEEEGDGNDKEEQKEKEEVENEADKINAIAQRYGSLSNVAIDTSSTTDTVGNMDESSKNLSKRFVNIMNTDGVLLDAGEKQVANEFASISPTVNSNRILTTLDGFLYQSRKHSTSNSQINSNSDMSKNDCNDDNGDKISSTESDVDTIDANKDGARFLYVQGRQWVHRNTILVRTISTDWLKLKIHNVSDNVRKSHFGAGYVYELLHALRHRVLFSARASEGYHLSQVMHGHETCPSRLTASAASTNTLVLATMIVYDHKKQRKEGFTAKLVELMGTILTHEQDCQVYSSFYFLSCCLQTGNTSLFVHLLKDISVLCRSFDTTALICGVALAFHDLCLHGDPRGYGIKEKDKDLSFRCLSTITMEEVHTACKGLLPRREEVAFCLFIFVEVLTTNDNSDNKGNNTSDVDAARKEYLSIVSQHLLVFLCYFCEHKQWSTQINRVKTTLAVNRCKDALRSLTPSTSSWHREQQKIRIRETGLWSTLYNPTSATSVALQSLGIQLDSSEVTKGVFSGILMESQVIDSDALHGVYCLLSCEGINEIEYLRWKVGEGEEKCTSLLAARIREADMIADESYMHQTQETLSNVFTFLESFLPSEYSALTCTLQPASEMIDREYGWRVTLKGNVVSLDARITMRIERIVSLLSNMTSIPLASTGTNLEEGYMVDVLNATVVSSTTLKKEALVVNQQDISSWQDMKHLFEADTTWAHVRTSNAEMNRHTTLLHVLLGHTSLSSDAFFTTLVRLSHLNKFVSETLLEELEPLLKEIQALLLCAVIEALMLLLCCYVKARMKVYLDDIHASLSIHDNNEKSTANTIATILRKGSHLKYLTALLPRLPAPWCSPARADVAYLLSTVFSTQYALCMLRSSAPSSSSFSYTLVHNRRTDAMVMETLRRQSVRLPVFVINLDRRVDRMRKLWHWMEAAQLLAIRVQAVDANAVSAGKNADNTEMEMEEDDSDLSTSQKNQKLFSRYFKLLCSVSTIDEISDEFVSSTWDSTLNSMFDTDCEVNRTTPMSKSERACAASHLKVWLAISQLRTQLFSTKPLPSLKASPPSPSLPQLSSSFSNSEPRASLYLQDDLRDEDKFLSTPLSIFNASRLGGGWDNYQSKNLPLHKKKKAKTKEKDTTIQNVHHLSNYETNDGDWYLILEDDATLNNLHRNNHFRGYLSMVMKYIPDDWDLLYLGHAAAPRGRGIRVGGMKKKKFGAGWFHKAKYVWQLHAYIIRGRAVDKLLSHLPIKGPVDNFVARLIHDEKLMAYTLQEQILTQDGSSLWERLKTSDIIHSGRKANHSYQAMEANRTKLKAEAAARAQKKQSREEKI